MGSAQVGYGSWPRGRPEDDSVMAAVWSEGPQCHGRGVVRRTTMCTVTVELFAGIPVDDYDRAVAWYERQLGSEPSFLPNDTEAVSEVGEHRFVFIEVRPG